MSEIKDLHRPRTRFLYPNIFYWWWCIPHKPTNIVWVSRVWPTSALTQHCCLGQKVFKDGKDQFPEWSRIQFVCNFQKDEYPKGHSSTDLISISKVTSVKLPWTSGQIHTPEKNIHASNWGWTRYGAAGESAYLPSRGNSCLTLGGDNRWEQQRSLQSSEPSRSAGPIQSGQW